MCSKMRTHIFEQEYSGVSANPLAAGLCDIAKISWLQTSRSIIALVSSDLLACRLDSNGRSWHGLLMLPGTRPSWTCQHEHASRQAQAASIGLVERNVGLEPQPSSVHNAQDYVLVHCC